MPSAVLVECKDTKIPVSLVNAFADPARPGHKGDLVKNSIEKMQKELDQLAKQYAIPVANRWWFSLDKYAINLECKHTKCATFDDLVSGVERSLDESDHE